MRLRNHPRTSAGDQQGMTLLEILLAMLVLATVVYMVSISLSGSLNVMNATRDHGEIYHKAQVALLRISEDLASAVLLPDVDFVGSDEQTGSQDSDTLRFPSTAHIVFNREAGNPGTAVISYTVREDPDQEGYLALFRADELVAAAALRDAAEEEGAGYMLSDRLRAVNFRYFTSDGEELEDWSTEVEPGGDLSDRRLPAAVSCTLEYWIDREAESSIEFTTSVVLPMGLINGQNE